MNEWPENLAGLDLNGGLFDTANKIFKSMLTLLVILASIGLAQGTELPTIIVAETTGWIDFSAWFADGAMGGFDAAGAGYGGW